MLLYDPDNVNLLVLIDLYLTIQGLSSAFFPFSAILLRLLFGFALLICQICQDNAATLENWTSHGSDAEPDLAARKGLSGHVLCVRCFSRKAAVTITGHPGTN